MERHGLCGGAHGVSGKHRDTLITHLLQAHTHTCVLRIHLHEHSKMHTYENTTSEQDVVCSLLYSTKSGQSEVV